MNKQSLTVVAFLVGGVGGLGCAMAVAACSVDTNGAAAIPEDSGTDSSAPDTSTGDDGAGGDSTMPGEASTFDTGPGTNDTGPGPDGAQPDGATGDAATDGPTGDAMADVVQPESDAGSDGAMGDAGGDAAPPSCTSANCNGVCCGTTCLNTLSCAACSVGTSFCPFNATVNNSNGECLPDCSTCSPGAVNLNTTCFTCVSGKPAAQSCVAAPDSCPAIGSATACSCDLQDAGPGTPSCPGSTQVCAPFAGGDGGSCATCGQTMNGGTQGLLCGAGPTHCGQASATCL